MRGRQAGGQGKGVKVAVTQGELYLTFSFRNQPYINKLNAYSPSIFFNSCEYEAVLIRDMKSYDLCLQCFLK